MIIAAFIISVVGAIVAVASVLVAAQAKNATLAQVDEMKEQNQLLREQLLLASRAQSADEMQGLDTALSSHTLVRDYLRRMSDSPGFAWDSAQREVAVSEGIAEEGVRRMLDCVERELHHPTYPDAEHVLNGFLKGTSPALDRVLEDTRGSDWPTLRTRYCHSARPPRVAAIRMSQRDA